MKSVPRWFALCSLGLGCFLLLVLVGDVWSTYRFVATAARAGGVVIELNAGAAHPQVKFELPSGESVEFPANGYISYRVGQAAMVLYSPDEPQKSARLDDFGDLWMDKIFDALVALTFIGLGLLKLLRP
jgi:hypothetical protein